MRRVGRVPQAEGARLLRRATSTCRRTTATWSTAGSSARRPRCSNTWRWAAASSASDLEQIGEVLSPALRVGRSRAAPTCAVADERAVLCTPGDVDEFVDAVVGLARRPRSSARRSAATPGRRWRDHYSWQRHVDAALARSPARVCRRLAAATPRAASRPATPTRSRSRTSGTTIRSVADRARARSRTRSSGSSKSSATGTATTRRGCRR